MVLLNMQAVERILNLVVVKLRKRRLTWSESDIGRLRTELYWECNFI